MCTVFLSRYIARKIDTSCHECQLLLMSPSKPENMEDNDVMMKAAAELIVSKDRGGLVYPTKFTIELAMVSGEELQKSNECRQPWAEGNQLFKVCC